jgi:hypothetical protein
MKTEDTINPKKLERVFRIFHDLKKVLRHDPHSDWWEWVDRDEQDTPGCAHGGFVTAWDAMLDACDPYLESDDE